MSDDLISRKSVIDLLITELNQHGDMYFAGKIIGLIDNLPTAFDKEKVIQSIESEYLKARCKNSEVCGYPESIGCCYDNGIKRAIEIVEKGGIE